MCVHWAFLEAHSLCYNPDGTNLAFGWLKRIIELSCVRSTLNYISAHQVLQLKIPVHVYSDHLAGDEYLFCFPFTIVTDNLYNV